MDVMALDHRRIWQSAIVLFVFISLGFTSTFDPYHDELMEKDDLAQDVEGNVNYDVEEIATIDIPTSGPHFDYSGFKNVTALVGNTAYLNCLVKSIGNKTVSWVRHRDIHLLTVGKFTYTSDQRFQTIHDVQSEEWTLKLRYPQIKDTGIYECQISTTPPKGYPVYLSVVEPLTTILGGPEILISMGSTINLTCIVKNSPESPFQMFWTHNNEEINYDSARGGVSVITEKGDVTTSYLLIQRAKSSDSGQYTCSPSNANPKSVNVHILNGEHPEAMHAGEISLKTTNILLLLNVMLLEVIVKR